MIMLYGAALASAEGISDIIARGATLIEIQSNFSFTEGPATDIDGNIYFSDLQAEYIYKWSYKDNSITLIREKTNRANGLMFDPKGRLIICEMATGRVTMDDSSGQIKVLAETYEGQKLHSPNDLWIDSKGGIYFSDYAGRRADQADTLHVYYITPDHKNLLQVTDAFIRPNGVIGSMDEKRLYVADSGAEKIWSYEIQPDGVLINKRLFCSQYSDGMTVDEKGNIYTTGRNEVVVYNSNGERIESIGIPRQPTNMTFCGKDRRTLFITARSTIYTIKMNVKGGQNFLPGGN